jgi:ribose transport system substrate-binding protein
MAVRRDRIAPMPRRAIALPSVLLCTLAVVPGCGNSGAGTTPNPSNASVAAVIKGLDNPFFGTMREGLTDAAARAHVRIRVEAATGQSDAAGQASRLDSRVASGAGCYIVNPINQANLIEPLSRVPKATPIVNIDSPIAQQQAAAVGVHLTTYIGTDNVAAGRAAAGAMARIVSKGARVVVLTGPPGDPTSDARIAGFRQGARGTFQVVASAAADFDRRKASQATEDLLAADGRLRGIFAANDLMALGSSTAVKRAGRGGEVAVIGVDGIREALLAVRRGALSATVAQYPFTIGQLGVQACVAAARHKKIPARIDAPIAVVTRSNVDRVRARFPRPVDAFSNPLAAPSTK